MKHLRLATAAFAAGLAPLALAQVAPQLPPTIEPGRIQERLQPPRAPRGAEIPELKGAEREPPEALKAVRVTLKSVRFEGASALPAERLQAQAGRYLGREIAVGDIFQLARELTATYRAAGYILSQVIVPPQSLADGVLTLRVVEGYIANVRIQGDSDAQRTLAELGEKIKASRPLHAAVLERYLLIANELPGVQLRSVLAPSQTPGAAGPGLSGSVTASGPAGFLFNAPVRLLGDTSLAASAGNITMNADIQSGYALSLRASGDIALVSGGSETSPLGMFTVASEIDLSPSN